MKLQINNIDIIPTKECFNINIHHNASQRDLEELLENLPEYYVLIFYDQYYPSRTDPGAYVFVQRTDNDFAVDMGNHGWSTRWQPQSKQMLASLLKLKIGAKDPYIDKIYQVKIEKSENDAFKT